MANSYTRTLVETTAAMSLIPKPAGVLAKHRVPPANHPWREAARRVEPRRAMKEAAVATQKPNEIEKGDTSNEVREGTFLKRLDCIQIQSYPPGT